MKQIGSVQDQKAPVAPEPRLRYKVRWVKRQRSTTGNVPVSSRMSATAVVFKLQKIFQVQRVKGHVLAPPLINLGELSLSRERAERQKYAILCRSAR